jgi:hypothetical protein
MTLLSWLFRKRSVPAQVGTPQVLAVESTHPVAQQGTRQAANNGGAQPAPGVGLREQFRAQSLARRGQLYATLRASLLRVGILEASYKFKVLALDQGARQFLVMIDLASSVQHNPALLMRVEASIAEQAKLRYDLEVPAVYWRTVEQPGPIPAASAGSAPETDPVEASRPENAEKKSTPDGVLDGRSRQGHEPIQTEEILAFKRALSVTAGPPSGTGPLHRYSPLVTGYEDTQVVSPQTRPASDSD